MHKGAHLFGDGANQTLAVDPYHSAVAGDCGDISHRAVWRHSEMCLAVISNTFQNGNGLGGDCQRGQRPRGREEGSASRHDQIPGPQVDSISSFHEDAPLSGFGNQHFDAFPISSPNRKEHTAIWKDMRIMMLCFTVG